METKQHILVSTSTFGRVDNRPLQKLKKTKIPVVLNPYGRRLQTEEISKLIKNAIGIVAGTERLSADVLSTANNLKVISRCGSGLDSVDLKAAHNLGIQVYNTPVSPQQSVAELTIALMLDVLRHVSSSVQKLKNGKWEPVFGNLLRGRTVGILGLGRVGSRVVELLESFQVQILAFENRPLESFVKKHKIQVLPLNTVLKRSDIISLHLSTDPTTWKIMGPKQFDTMKPKSILINTARGELIDEVALEKALSSGKLAGVGMDVYANEPYNGPLLKYDNAVLTPHMGSYSMEARMQMEDEAVDNLLQGLKLAKAL